MAILTKEKYERLFIEFSAFMNEFTATTKEVAKGEEAAILKELRIDMEVAEAIYMAGDHQTLNGFVMGWYMRSKFETQNA